MSTDPGTLYGGDPVTEVTHFCPHPDFIGALFLCCGLTPFEVPRTDRMTLDPALVTCHAPEPEGAP